jgi:DNA replication ATP-dependent helicase Dna2
MSRLVDLSAPKFLSVTPQDVEHLFENLVSYEVKLSKGESPYFSSFESSKFQLHSNIFTLVDGCHPSSVIKAWENLNAEQRTAVTKVLGMRDYALIQGMPGTGKTATIAVVIRLLVSLGKSVLATAYTNSAVDNVLLKLKKMNVPVLRVGNIPSVNEQLRDCTFQELAKESYNSLDFELHSFSRSFPVVGVTCLNTRHILLEKNKFDVCIVDEAAQITQPVCLGPILKAHRFVLVGDHYQLPPLVKNEVARLNGLSTSLFCELAEKHPNAVVQLNAQYRMNQEIMTLSNMLIYSMTMKCGSPQVARNRLVLPTPLKKAGGRNWITEAVLNVQLPVVFLCTDSASHEVGTKVPLANLSANSLTNTQTKYKKSPRSNNMEATIVLRCVEALVKCSLPEASIGILAPYR